MRPSFSKIILRALLIAYILSGFLLLLLALALYKLNLSESQTGIAVYIIYVLACMIGGLVAGKIAGSRRFFWGLFIGAIYCLLLTLLSLLFEDGTLPDFHRFLKILGCCMASGMFGGIIS
ncbi:MAG: TIGR04086 family membrane protein [Brotaphodocola sp.]